MERNSLIRRNLWKSCMLPAVILMLFILFAVNVYAYEDDEVLGTVEFMQKATNDYGNLAQEMELCDTVADAVAAISDADIVILNGGDFAANLQGGVITWADVQALFTENRQLAVAQISGAQLFEILETGFSYATLASDETLDLEESAFEGFPQISGFSLYYDPSAPAGERLLTVELADGTLVTEDMELTLAATEYMLIGNYGYPTLDYEALGVTLAEAMAAYFELNDGVISDPEETDRITAIGVRGRFSLGRPTIFVISTGLIVAWLFLGKGLRHTREENKLY